MQTIDFTNYIKQEFGLSNVYPNTLPDNENLNTGVFLYDSLNSFYDHTNSLFVQLLFSGTERTQLEAYANDFIKKLNFECPVKIGNDLLVGMQKMQLQPIYLGERNGFYKFSLNLQLFMQD